MNLKEVLSLIHLNIHKDNMCTCVCVRKGSRVTPGERSLLFLSRLVIHRIQDRRIPLACTSPDYFSLIL